MVREYSLYLQVGDYVYHKYFKRWGIGVVVEERRSELPGGFCYVRINFQDGKLRVFDNNLRSENCCYYAGIVRIENEKDISPSPCASRRSDSNGCRKKALPKGHG
jgi:hypothetical protein